MDTNSASTYRRIIKLEAEASVEGGRTSFLKCLYVRPSINLPRQAMEAREH